MKATTDNTNQPQTMCEAGTCGHRDCHERVMAVSEHVHCWHGTEPDFCCGCSSEPDDMPTLARVAELEALLSKVVGDIERLGFVGADTIELVGLALVGKVVE